jgi:tetratricopeptide (TPR) repeat protein
MRKTFWMMALLATARFGMAATPAKIHGHVQDPLGSPVAFANILLTDENNSIKYTFVTDVNGDYKGDGIASATYNVQVQKAPEAGNVSKSMHQSTSPGTLHNILDSQNNVRFPEGADVQVDFDMSRKAYVDKLSPEMRKALEEARAKNAAISKENLQIKNLNSLILQARAARTANNFDQAVALDQQAVQINPNEGLLWYELGASQTGLKKYDDAIASYKKSIDLLQAAKPPKPDLIAASYNDLGTTYAKAGKADEAVAAFESAAKIMPTQAAMYYDNEAAVLYQAGLGDAAGAAADKAIAADPSKPIPYYVKGWSLVQKATVDPKTQKIILPPGCADAYRKFLELAPDSPLAADAKSILESAGEPIHSSYHKKH